MRRVTAAIAAVILAIVGAFLLTSYVRSADERAMEGLETTTVLVVNETVPVGTTAEDAATMVEAQTLPKTAVAPDALSDLGDVAGLATSTDLLPGEQVLESRFADEDSVAGPARIDTPEGYQEVTIQLEAQRVLGGLLKAGDLVGVIFAGTLAGEEESLDMATTVLEQVLVTRVALTQPVTDENGERAPQSLFVTFAVDTPQAETIVFGMEHASVWLTLQPEGELAGTSQLVTPEVILK